MSDRRIRTLQCAHRVSPGDHDIHAKLIAEGLRRKEIEPHALALCAYIRHRPSEIVLTDAVKQRGNNFVWFERAINRTETTQLIDGLRYWGSRILIMGTLGFIERALVSVSRDASYFHDVMGMVEHLDTYSKTADKPTSIKLLRDIRYWPTRAPNMALPSWRDNPGESSLRRIRSAMAARSTMRRPFSTSSRVYPGLDVLKRFAIDMDDALFMKILGKKIIPWALGDAYL